MEKYKTVQCFCFTYSWLVVSIESKYVRFIYIQVVESVGKLTYMSFAVLMGVGGAKDSVQHYG